MPENCAGRLYWIWLNKCLIIRDTRLMDMVYTRKTGRTFRNEGAARFAFTGYNRIYCVN